jgi:hypothetical protein
MCEKGPIIIENVEAFDVLDNEGKVGDLYTGLVSSDGVSVIKEIAEQMGAECQVGDPLTDDEVGKMLEDNQNESINDGHGNGKSFSLCNVKKDLPYLSGSAWGNKTSLIQ